MLEIVKFVRLTEVVGKVVTAKVAFADKRPSFLETKEVFVIAVAVVSMPNALDALSVDMTPDVRVVGRTLVVILNRDVSSSTVVYGELVDWLDVDL